MMLQLRSMGVVLPNMGEPETVLLEETPHAQARRSMLLEDSEDLIDLMALGKLNLEKQ